MAGRVLGSKNKSPRPLLTHCNAGHEYTPKNTRIKRTCIACQRAFLQAHRGKKDQRP